ncbi:hypothetical protein CIK76_18900, partial [Glutamicibacter sp. BW80]
MACEGWQKVNPICHMGDGIKNAVGDAITNVAGAVMEGFGQAIASLGTIWARIGTPNLTGGTQEAPIGSNEAPEKIENIDTVLGYVMWFGIAAAGIAMVILGLVVATKMRRGEGFAAVGKLGYILGGVVLVGASSSLVGGLLPSGPSGSGGTVLFLQNATWWLVAAMAVLSIIIGGIQVAVSMKGQAAIATLRSLLTLLAVSGVGVLIVGLLVAVFDAYSIWVLNGSVECDIAGSGDCFGANMITLLALTANPATTGGLGPMLVIILGLIAILCSFVQILMMVARGGMLVILCGIFPLSASFTNTQMGMQWFMKNVGWLIAFMLYKPAAATVYAAAFHLAGTNVFQDDGTGLISILTGLMLMVLALFALPALMRFVTPLVGSMASGAAGGALAAGLITAVAAGAGSMGNLLNGSSNSNSGTDEGPTGSENSSAPSNSNDQAPDGSTDSSSGT